MFLEPRVTALELAGGTNWWHREARQGQSIGSLSLYLSDTVISHYEIYVPTSDEKTILNYRELLVSEKLKKKKALESPCLGFTPSVPRNCRSPYTLDLEKK